MMRHLRHKINVSWRDKITNIEILKKAIHDQYVHHKRLKLDWAHLQDGTRASHLPIQLLLTAEICTAKSG